MKRLVVLVIAAVALVACTRYVDLTPGDAGKPPDDTHFGDAAFPDASGIPDADLPVDGGVGDAATD